MIDNLKLEKFLRMEKWVSGLNVKMVTVCQKPFLHMQILTQYLILFLTVNLNL
jgi:hypothetical protein